MMAAGSSHLALSRPMAVVNPAFCVPYVLDLIITRKLIAITDGNFRVTDVNGNTIFKLRGTLLSLHERRVLLDSAGHPVATLRKKILTAHGRWEVFRGDSSDSKDLLFSAKKSSMIQLKTKLDVFLAGNTREDVPDFRVDGSWVERSCTVYAGNSSTIIAQMHRKYTAQSILFGKDTFSVSVYPNIDHAFIAALIVILEEINEEKHD